jgi:hypothetical protein
MSVHATALTLIFVSIAMIFCPIYAASSGRNTGQISLAVAIFVVSGMLMGGIWLHGGSYFERDHGMLLILFSIPNGLTAVYTWVLISPDSKG